MVDFKRSLIKRFTLLIIVISIAIYYVLSTVKLSKLIDVVQKSDPTFIILALLVFYLSIYIRSHRWKIFLSDLEIKVSTSESVKLYVNGQYLNLFLPMKLGDVYRGIVTGQKSSSDISKVMATIVSERFIDLVLLSVGIAVFAPLALTSQSAISDVLIWVSVVLLAGVFVSYIAYVVHNRPDLVPYFQDTRENFFSGIRNVIKSIKNRYLTIPGLSLTIWLTNVIRLAFVAEALQIEISIFGIFFISLLLGLASGLPYIPSGIGVFEILGTQALISLGISSADALAIVLIERGINTISFSLFGTIVYAYTRTKDNMDLNVKNLVQNAREIRD